MPEIKTEFLFTMDLEFEVSILGNTPYGVRRIARLSTGSFGGPKLKGTVLPGGGGWMLIRRDDVLEIEARLTLETDDTQQIYMNWKGLRHGPKEVIDASIAAYRRPPELLFPYYAVLRDEFGKVQLVKPHLLDRHRFACGKRADSVCI
jgi:Protein of unknown function (DUF3237)